MLALKIILGTVGGVICLLVLFALFTMICSATIDCSKGYDKNSPFFRFLLDFWTAFMVIVMRIKIERKGLDRIPDGRFVIVSNHKSNFDPIITWYLLRKNKLAYLSKESNFHVPWFGKIIRKCCFMVIDRENPREALKTVEKAAELIKNNEVSIGVYPEGTRNRTEEPLLPFHNGMFKVAKKARVPLVVAALKGTDKIHSNFPLHGSRVSFEIVDVIYPDCLLNHTDSEIGEKVKEEIFKTITG